MATASETIAETVVVPVREAARLLRVTPATVIRHIQLGEIPAHKLGNRWMVPTIYLREIAGGDSTS